MLITDVWNNSQVFQSYGDRRTVLRPVLSLYTMKEYMMVTINDYSELSDEYDAYRFAVKHHLVYYKISHGEIGTELAVEKFYHTLVI